MYSYDRGLLSLRNIVVLAGRAGFAVVLLSNVCGGTARGAASAPIPVEFKGGACSADVDGTVSERGSVTYALNAAAGQMLAIEVDGGYAAPMEVGIPGGVSKIAVSKVASSQYWTGTVLRTGPVDIVIHGGDPVASDPDPSKYRMHVSVLGRASENVARIDRVDFSNGTVSLGAGSAYQLKDGKLAPPYDDKYLHVSARTPVFGDIDGLPGTVAAVFVDYDDSGTGEFGVVDLFTLESGVPVLVAVFSGGDRAEGGLEKARIERGRLVVDIAGSPPGGPACCPVFVDTVPYRFVAGKLVRDGPSSRRKYTPPPPRG